MSDEPPVPASTARNAAADHPGMPWPDAHAHARRVPAPTAVQWVPVDSASGRVLAEDVRAPVSLPGDDVSAMDGWAVSGVGPWRVVREPRLGDGQAVEVVTGGTVPPGCTGVVIREHGSVSGGLLSSPRPAGAHIRAKGEEVVAGEALARSGELVSPPLAGLLAAAGVDRVPVRPKPRVTVVITGSEIATEGLPGPGRARDAIGVQLPSLLSGRGAAIVDLRYVPDSVEQLAAELGAACAAAQLVVTVGGTGPGPRDLIRTALGRVGGTIEVTGVAVRPGHPMAMGVAPGGAIWVGLPGNPLAALAGVVTLIYPALDGVAGRNPEPSPLVVLRGPVGAPADHWRLAPAALVGAAATVVHHSGPAMLRGAAAADGFAVITPGGALEGDRVPWLSMT